MKWLDVGGKSSSRERNRKGNDGEIRGMVVRKR